MNDDFNHFQYKCSIDYFFCVSRIIWASHDDKIENNSFMDNQNEVIEKMASSRVTLEAVGRFIFLAAWRAL